METSLLCTINDRISYIKASEGPLSSDVIIIKGNESTWIYDVGHSDEAFEVIKAIPGHKNIVLSHFHADHIGNVSRLTTDVGADIDLFVSRQTCKYTNTGAVLEKKLVINDGIKLEIVPLPSSHSKGCLALVVDDKYAFLGDAIYPRNRDGNAEYNVQKLKEQIDLLENVSADEFFLSHSKKPLIEKRVLISFLKSIYEKRIVGNNVIIQNSNSKIKIDPALLDDCH